MHLHADYNMAVFFYGVRFMTNEELVLAIQSGQREYLEQLYLQNTGMIEKIVRQFREQEAPEDLRQEAFFGIVRAADLWKPDKGANFISYAAYWIRQTIQRYICYSGGGVHMPADRRAIVSRYRRAASQYKLRFGRDPSGRELCALLEVTPGQLEQIRKDAATLNTRSMNEPVGGESEEITLADTIADQRDMISDVLEEIQREELARDLWECVATLEDKQAAVIRGLYREGRTPEKCGAALGMTAGKVRRLEFKALSELSRGRNARRLLPYLTESAAYDYGLRGNGVGAFRRKGSSQEAAMMYLEERAGISLNGVKFPALY